MANLPSSLTSSAGARKKAAIKYKNYNTPAKPGTKLCKNFKSGKCNTSQDHPEWQHICSYWLTTINRAFPHMEVSCNRKRLTQEKKSLKGVVSITSSPCSSRDGSVCGMDTVVDEMDLPLALDTIMNTYEMPSPECASLSLSGVLHMIPDYGSILLGLSLDSLDPPQHAAKASLAWPSAEPHLTRHLPRNMEVMSSLLTSQQWYTMCPHYILLQSPALLPQLFFCLVDLGACFTEWTSSVHSHPFRPQLASLSPWPHPQPGQGDLMVTSHHPTQSLGTAWGKPLEKEPSHQCSKGELSGSNFKGQSSSPEQSVVYVAQCVHFK